MILSLTLTVLGALSSAIFPSWSNNDDSIYTILALSRFILGIGVGGVYPLSAAVAAENSLDPILNSRRVAAVFSFQGWGQLVSFLLTYVLLNTDMTHATIWRLLLGAGALPGLFVLHAAVMSTETGVFDQFKHQLKKNQLKNLNQIGGHHDQNQSNQYVPPPSSSVPLWTSSVWTALQQHDIFHAFIGTSLGWFLFDLTFYGNIIFTPIIVKDLYNNRISSNNVNMVEIAQFSLLMSVIALPGYYLSWFMVGRLEWKYIQIQGFAWMSILFFVLGGYYTQLLPQRALLFMLYALTFFFSNFGPNVSTFSLPVELFPVDVRVQLNGMSAAAGKSGAAVGAFLYGIIERYNGVSSVLIVSGFVSLIGLLVTYVCIPSSKPLRSTTT
jgi:PHS family inorganic phosphate transporter-like MFS transporter